MSTLLLAIDCQNDFMQEDGALAVPNGEENAERIYEYIVQNQDSIDKIVATMDSHHMLDISHPIWWRDKEGNHPEPMTVIGSKEIEEGKYIPNFEPAFFELEWSEKYVKKLEENGSYTHVIWPYHCIIGSHGHALHEHISTAIQIWESNQKEFAEFTMKGEHPFTEHFGALYPNVKIEGVDLRNHLLEEYLHNYDNIIVVGEAKTHCVAFTLSQFGSNILSKTTILEDCMSDVPGFEEFAKPVYERAEANGAKITTSGIELDN